MKAATGKEFSQYETMAKIMDSNQAPLFKTTFSGTRCDPLETGKIEKITDTNFLPGKFVYGIMVGMIQELYDYSLEMPIRKHLVLSGNGFRKNKELCKVAEKLFGLKAILSTNLEEAATGASLLIKYIKRK
ncbi:MAG: hypothetical protein Q4C49_09825 [Bacillota bacterium]|nr:hypothetical protein [Bacillota bacterium]